MARLISTFTATGLSRAWSSSRERTDRARSGVLTTTPYGELRLASVVGEIRVIDEPAYTFGSVDNARRYPDEFNFEGEWRVHSVQGISVDGNPRMAVGATGGPTVVHPHSAVVVWGQLFLAVGDVVARFSIDPFELKSWCRGDTASCFGLHYSGEHDALICHGELGVSRISPTCEVVWWKGGKDVFTGDFTLCADFIEAYDWQNDRYRFRYDTGAIL